MKAAARILALLLACAAPGLAWGEDAGAKPAETTYQTRRPSPYGIGKVYFGREIARVMSHLGADWLERPEREQEERPTLLVSELGLKPTDVVADVGAGNGYLTFLMSARVPQGRVIAVDIQPEMLAMLVKARKARGISNVETVLGTIEDPRLPTESIDWAVMVDAYHEFSQPREMMQAIVRALRPGGRVALVEYRGEDPEVPILPTHKMTQEQAKKEMAAVSLRWVETKNALPQQHLMIFEKPASTPRPRASCSSARPRRISASALEIADHLNVALEQLDEPERVRALDINVRAGKQALLSGAADTACRYFAAGQHLLREADWAERAHLAFDLLMRHIEGALQTRAGDVGLGLIAALERRPLTYLQQAQVDAKRISLRLLRAKQG